jgi:hypothetical protein
MPFSTVQATDAMTHGHPIVAVPAFDRALIHGKNQCVALFQVLHQWARLHARALFGEDEFAAGKILARF